MVVATQNPIEQAGTYSLPEAQLDRFMHAHVARLPRPRVDAATSSRLGVPSRVAVEPIVELKTIVAMAGPWRARCTAARSCSITSRASSMRRATRPKCGSERRCVAQWRSRARSRVWALAHDRTYVTPDDVKTLADAVLAHRLILDPEAEFDGVTRHRGHWPGTPRHPAAQPQGP